MCRRVNGKVGHQRVNGSTSTSVRVGPIVKSIGTVSMAQVAHHSEKRYQVAHHSEKPGCTSLRKKVPGCTSPRKKVKHVQATNGNHSHDRSAHWPQVVLEPHLYDQVGVGVVLLKPFGQFGQPARVTPHQIHTKNWELPPSTMSTTVCLPTTWPFPRP
jgi:hypothetical protein